MVGGGGLEDDERERERGRVRMGREGEMLVRPRCVFERGKVSNTGIRSPRRVDVSGPVVLTRAEACGRSRDGVLWGREASAQRIVEQRGRGVDGAGRHAKPSTQTTRAKRPAMSIERPLPSCAALSSRPPSESLSSLPSSQTRIRHSETRVQVETGASLVPVVLIAVADRSTQFADCGDCFEKPASQP